MRLQNATPDSGSPAEKVPYLLAFTLPPTCLGFFEAHWVEKGAELGGLVARFRESQGGCRRQRAKIAALSAGRSPDEMGGLCGDGL